MKALFLLTFLVFVSSPGWAKHRHYYIGINETTWNYAPTGKNMLNGKPISEDQEFQSQVYLKHDQDRIGPVYKKALYVQYTDDTFQKIIEKPPWLGLLGPIIKAETGDLVFIHVRNFASRMYSFHPHGMTYTKENEGRWILSPYTPELLLIDSMSPILQKKQGALYPDNTTGLEKEDDHLKPGSSYTYKWFVDENQGPAANDSDCVTRIYHSHVDSPKDVASGLIGPMMTCKRGRLDGDTEKNIDKSYVLLFTAIDENKSWYLKDNIKMYTEPGQVNPSDPDFINSNIMYSINGYMYGNLPTLTMCAEDRVRWHFIGMGDYFDVHPIYIQEQTLIFRNHRKVTITVFPASMEDALMVAKGTGEWMLGCPIYESMKAFFNVRNCQNSSADVTGTDVIHYYIAAEKIFWNYAPTGIDFYTEKSLTAEGSESQIYFEQGPTRIGGTYQKLVYREYTDASFQTQKAREEHLGILGPVIKAEVGQIVKVTFYNNGPLPLSIQPQGLRYSKDNEGSFYKTPGGSTPPASSHVEPGTTFVYTWQVSPDVGPTSTDPDCLTNLYYSSVSGTKDMSTGLVGPLLVCRKGSLGEDGKQKGIDREFYLLAAKFDENDSYLLDENIRTYITEAENVNKKDPDFQASNVMNSMNGYMYGNLPGLDMCLGDNVSWHLLSVGSGPDLHGIYFSGNTFITQGHRDDTVPLFPHTSHTVFMTPDSIGNFDVMCPTSQFYQGGMKNKYEVRQCSEPHPDQTQYQEKIVYIAAEEIVWDYAPSREWEKELKRLQGEENKTDKYLDRTGTFLGSKYKKVVYRQYDDITFTNKTKRNEDEIHLDILGPLIFAAPGEKLRIIFQNKASNPYSIYAHGVKTHNSTIVPTQPGETRTYLWEIPEGSGPTSHDFECITFFYASSVNLVKDLNSGLVGPLIVCRNETKANIVHRVLLFMIFNEAESWYYEENINTYSLNPNQVDRNDLEFQLSNHMHVTLFQLLVEFNKPCRSTAINGRMFANNQGLTFHVGDEVNLYLIGLGDTFDLHTAHFHGHSFEFTDLGVFRSDVYDLTPGVHRTVKMFPRDVGTWLFHCHVSQHIFDGMESTYTVIE